MNELQWQRFIPSPLGALCAVTDGHALVALDFDRGGSDSADVPATAARLLDRVAGQLAEYFAGARTTFDIPLAPHGTPFQQAVWQALLAIAYGRSASYGDVARAIGQPTAVRAVGAANGRNPIAIVVPCHRVIGADGTLTGYAGGLARKRALLALEAQYAFALQP
jgi:methylated-DNA-[protein]-cysteine S-methyltransferase